MARPGFCRSRAEEKSDQKTPGGGRENTNMAEKGTTSSISLPTFK